MPNNNTRRAEQLSQQVQEYERLVEQRLESPLDRAFREVQSAMGSYGEARPAPPVFFTNAPTQAVSVEPEPYYVDYNDEDDYVDDDFDTLDYSNNDGEDYNESGEPYKSVYDIAYDAFQEMNLSLETMPVYERQHYLDLKRSFNQNVQHRRSWIFDRIEREGFERRRLGKFSLDDLLERIGKRAEHKLNTETSKFYDWKLGGTEYIIRLEYIKKEDAHLLVCQYIYTPTNEMFRRDLRYWNGQKFELIDEQTAHYQY